MDFALKRHIFHPLPIALYAENAVAVLHAQRYAQEGVAFGNGQGDQFVASS